MVIPRAIYDVSNKSVSYKYEVERFTQGELTIPIQIKNKPDSLNINIYPKAINLQFQSPLSRYDDITPEQFLLTVDYNEKGSNSELQVKIEDHPYGIRNMRLVKSFITFIATEQ